MKIQKHRLGLLHGMFWPKDQKNRTASRDTQSANATSLFDAWCIPYGVVHTSVSTGTIHQDRMTTYQLLKDLQLVLAMSTIEICGQYH